WLQGFRRPGVHPYARSARRPRRSRPHLRRLIAPRRSEELTAGDAEDAEKRGEEFTAGDAEDAEKRGEEFTAEDAGDAEDAEKRREGCTAGDAGHPAERRGRERS